MLFQLLEDQEAWNYFSPSQNMQEIKRSPGLYMHTMKS